MKPFQVGIMNVKNLLEIVREYFMCGYEYEDILKLLSQKHEVIISIRTLHRILRKEGLRRKSTSVNSLELVTEVRQMIENGGQNRGYRSVHQRLLQKGVQVSRHSVRQAVKIIDPEGNERRSKHRLKRRVYCNSGPNDVWHIDGNDKLKSFGFYIHGGIDGFSRKILWLEVANSNKDPRYIGYHFTKTVERLGTLPKRVRGKFIHIISIPLTLLSFLWSNFLANFSSLAQNV